MSNTIEKTIKNFCIDRSDWELVRFGDVALQQKESVDRDDTDITRYVKGEHMYSEDLHLREWGELKNEYLGPAFIRLFEKGDILYGSRRTYLRKVTIAPFEGITSNTTFVIKANESKIDKRLLPFVMLSEGFSEHSIRNSKGSVNPYVNWKDLANYEFLLPPKKQQAQLAQLLWAMDEVIEKDLAVLEKLETALTTIIERKLSNNPTKILADYCDGSGIKIGPFGSLLHSYDYCNDGIPVVMPADIVNGKITSEKISKISYEKSKELRGYLLSEGDILFPRRGDLSKRAIVNTSEEGWVCGTGTIRVRALQKTPKALLYYALTSKSVNDYLNSSSVGTTMQNINVGIVSRIPVELPKDKDECNKLEATITAILSQKKNSFRKISSSKSLLKSLINQVF